MTDRTKPAVNLVHTDAAADWANSELRAPVFSVTRTVDNPEFGVSGDEGNQPATILVTETYTMPAKPNAGLALRFLKMARENADLAMSWLIETAVGEKGYDALADDLMSADDPQAALQQVIARIQQVALGGLEAPKD